MRYLIYGLGLYMAYYLSQKFFRYPLRLAILTYQPAAVRGG